MKTKVQNEIDTVKKYNIRVIFKLSRALYEGSLRHRHTSKHPCIDCKKRTMQGFCMKEYIEERAIEIAYYIIEHKATVRQTARQFGVSKSTIHKDVTERLLTVNPSLAAEVRKVLDVNKSERHIRGGMATREKYLHQHELSETTFKTV